MSQDIHPVTVSFRWPSLYIVQYIKRSQDELSLSHASWVLRLERNKKLSLWRFIKKIGFSLLKMRPLPSRPNIVSREYTFFSEDSHDRPSVIIGIAWLEPIKNRERIRIYRMSIWRNDICIRSCSKNCLFSSTDTD